MYNNLNLTFVADNEPLDANRSYLCLAQGVWFVSDVGSFNNKAIFNYSFIQVYRTELDALYLLPAKV